MFILYYLAWQLHRGRHWASELRKVLKAAANLLPFSAVCQRVPMLIAEFIPLLQAIHEDLTVYDCA
jgi:hypothetical protein